MKWEVGGPPILVTGAASGIGAALVDILTDAGVTVIGVDRTDGPGITGCDLGDEGAIEGLIRSLPPRLGGIANVAGVPGTAPADVVLKVNSLAPRHLVEALADRVVAGGAVINVASVAAHRNGVEPAGVRALNATRTAQDVDQWLIQYPLDGPAAYDTSKRAVVEWSAATAARLLPTQVRCLSVSPGPVETPILDDFAQSMGAESMARSEAAVGRHGRPAEIAAVVAFALSPAATWLNGIDILVEGGLMAARTAAALSKENS